jgi:Flp pilus assembly protein TadD
MMASARRAARINQSGQSGRVNPAVGQGKGLLALRNRPVILCLALLLATLAAYSAVGQASFVNLDDSPYVTMNEHVQAGLTWRTIAWAFRSTDESNWHPLTWISHAADCELFGLDPAGHHYTNLLFHEVNVALLFFLLRRLMSSTWRSLTVAALFALHPVNVESVAWVAERKNVLSMFFFLLTLTAYGWYVLKPQLSRYVLVAALFACGLMAKPQVVTLPFVLLLLDYWPLGRGSFGTSDSTKPDGGILRFLELLREKVPLLLLSAASSFITYKVQSESGAVSSGPGFQFATRAENAVVSYARYLGKAFWPFGLAPMYPHPGASIRLATVVMSALLLAGITALVITLRKRAYLAIGWFWFLGILLPMLGLIQVGDQAMADRYAYIPFIGIFIMVCWGAGEWIKQKNLPAKWCAVPVLAVLSALATITYRQVEFWHDSVSLWTHTIAVTGPNRVAEDDLGEALIHSGRVEEAMPHFQVAARIDPRDSRAQIRLAYHAHQEGRWQDAAEHYQIAVNLAANSAMRVFALRNLGFVENKLGDFDAARKSYASALQLSPNDAESMVGLGLVAQQTGNASEAVRQFTRATAVQPSDVAYLLLSRALEKTGRSAEAATAYDQAKTLSTNFAQARQTVESMTRR